MWLSQFGLRRLFVGGLVGVCAFCAPPVICAALTNPLFGGWYADPQIRQFDGGYWIFPTYSHDFKEQTFIDAFSSKDLRTWTKHPHVLTTNEVKWAKGAMWAPDAQEKDGKSVSRIVEVK